MGFMEPIDSFSLIVSNITRYRIKNIKKLQEINKPNLPKLTD